MRRRQFRLEDSEKCEKSCFRKRLPSKSDGFASLEVKITFPRSLLPPR